MSDSTYIVPPWDQLVALSEVSEVDEALRTFIEDPHEDSCVCMIRTILSNSPAYKPL